jgi:hypothetical protein
MEDAILVHFTPKGETVSGQISICVAQWKSSKRKKIFIRLRNQLRRAELVKNATK